MIELVQNENLLIGSSEAVTQLASKVNPRVLLVSDSHGGSSVFTRIVQDYGKDCDALIFTGDGIADVARLLAAAENDKSLMEAVPPVIAVVQGNNDPSSYVVSKSFLIKVPVRQVLTVGNQNLLIVHGHKQGIDFGYELMAFEAQLSEAKIGVYGHTHICRETLYGNNNEYKFINAGSISLPRGGLPPSFAILNFCGRTVMPVFIQIKRTSSSELQYSTINPFW